MGEGRERGEERGGERESEGEAGIFSDISYIPSYTFIYLYTPLYTFIYLYIHSYTPNTPYTLVYPHVPHNIQY